MDARSHSVTDNIITALLTASAYEITNFLHSLPLITPIEQDPLFCGVNKLDSGVPNSN